MSPALHSSTLPLQWQRQGWLARARHNQYAQVAAVCSTNEASASIVAQRGDTSCAGIPPHISRLVRAVYRHGRALAELAANQSLSSDITMLPDARTLSHQEKDDSAFAAAVLRGNHDITFATGLSSLHVLEHLSLVNWSAEKKG